MQFVSNSIESLTDPVEYLNELIKDYSTFLLVGDLGAGKTTLVQKWMKSIGIHDLVSSPTFSIVNHYQHDKGTIYHMDLYRIKSVEEAWNIGIDEYFSDQEAIVIIEWPEIIESLIEEPYVICKIDVESGQRVISIRGIGSFENS